VNVPQNGWLEVSVGTSRIVVSLSDPVAVVQTPGSAEVVASWPDLDVGLRAVSATVMRAPTGAWVFYRSLESEDEALPAGQQAAVHVAVDGSVIRFSRVAQHRIYGTTRHGLWLTSDRFPDPRDEEDWRRATQAVILGADGTERTFAIDRKIAIAIDDGTRAPRLVLFAGAPTANRRGVRTTFSYSYVSVPLSDDTFAVTHVADLTTEEFGERDVMDLLPAITPRPPATPPQDCAIRWNPVTLSQAEKDAAVDSVVGEFAHLANYWRTQDGRSSPLSRGLADPRVEAVGEWPHTRVEVSFTHPHFPQGRLRRTLRVFDDAGRIIPALYASVHLMEDVDTKDLPDASTARDGILDMDATSLR
jgi:hypothetical protein